MDIIIRNLERKTVAALDDLANAQGKSRNQYISEQLYLLANHRELQEKDDQYRHLLEKMLAVIKENTQVLEELMK